MSVVWEEVSWTSDLLSTAPRDPHTMVTSLTTPTHGPSNDISSALNVIYLILLVFTTVVGNIGNVMVIGAVLCDRRLRKEGNIFIVNLAIADLCVTSFVNPFSIAGVVVGHEWFLQRHGLCHLIGSICLVSCVCSLWSIAAIGLNRYMLLCQQRYYHRIFSWKTSTLIALCLWLVALCLDLPNFLDWGDHTYDMKTMACSYDRTASYSYTVFFITLFVTIPLMVVLYCNINIYIFVIQSKIRVAAHKKNALGGDGSTVTEADSITETTTISTKVPQTMTMVEQSHEAGSRVPLVTTEPSSGGRGKMEELQVKVSKDTYNTKKVGKPHHLPTKRDMRREVRLARTLFIVFMAFCTCWAPYALLCLIDRNDQVSKVAYTLAILLAHSSSTLNSILYAATNKGFRDGYMVFLKVCGFKCFS